MSHYQDSNLDASMTRNGVAVAADSQSVRGNIVTNSVDHTSLEHGGYYPNQHPVYSSSNLRVNSDNPVPFNYDGTDSQRVYEGILPQGSVTTDGDSTRAPISAQVAYDSKPTGSDVRNVTVTADTINKHLASLSLKSQDGRLQNPTSDANPNAASESAEPQQLTEEQLQQRRVDRARKLLQDLDNMSGVDPEVKKRVQISVRSIILGKQSSRLLDYDEPKLGAKQKKPDAAPVQPTPVPTAAASTTASVASRPADSSANTSSFTYIPSQYRTNTTTNTKSDDE